MAELLGDLVHATGDRRPRDVLPSHQHEPALVLSEQALALRHRGERVLQKPSAVVEAVGLERRFDDHVLEAQQRFGRSKGLLIAARRFQGEHHLVQRP
ncbi:hypothetical protein ACWGET_30175 [Streptomyces zaomyceticus]